MNLQKLLMVLKGKSPPYSLCFVVFCFGPTLKALTLSTYYTNLLLRVPEPPTLLLQDDNVEGTCSWTSVEQWTIMCQNVL